MKNFWIWLGERFHGHVNIGPLVIYGENAMHFAWNLRTPWGWLCFKPNTYCFGVWWPWYVYHSEDATPYRPHFLWGYR